MSELSQTSAASRAVSSQSQGDAGDLNLPFAIPGRIAVERLPQCGRLILRGREAARARASEALGIAIPDQPCRSVQDAMSAAQSPRVSTVGRAALWLGPDEWLVLIPVANVPATIGQLQKSLGPIPHALVDIGDRQIALRLSGAMAPDVLSVGCPLDFDIDAFPVGQCTRTVFDKAEVILWRVAPDCFHVEIARSLLAYVAGHIGLAARGLAAVSA